MAFNYKNPLSGTLSLTTESVGRTAVYGNTFSVLNIGGYMEVWNLDDLYLTLTAATYPSQIQLSANTIPINIMIGSGSVFSPNILTLNSDNISSGRRRLGMQVFVQETDTVYQYSIPNYETLWNGVVGLTGSSAITESDFSTLVNNRSQAGRDFISAWTGSTIEGVNGVSRNDARWKIFYGTDWQITGGTFFSATSTLDLYTNTGGTLSISGFNSSVTGGTYSSGTSMLTLNNSDGSIIEITGLTSGSGLSVGDGITTVNSVSGITFSGASVIDDGGGNITVVITGGTSGSSGSSGTSGSSGSSGTSGSSGSSGTSGSSGSSGTSGTGFSGITNPSLSRILTSDGTPYGAIAESGLTYDSNTKTLNVDGDSIQYGSEYQQSGLRTSLTNGTSIITTIPVVSGCSANFDYCVTESGGAMRAGTVKVVWNSTTAGYTDYSTTDIESSTNDISFTADVGGGNLRLNAVIASGIWSVKVSTDITF